jgi:DNA-binding LacI/PurR family transcriptional regulator
MAARAESGPTLEMVGALAGVSRATVSRVINRSPKVSPEARRAVERAIEQLGYTPNRAARTLVTRRNDAIALLVNEPETRVIEDPFLGAVARGISRAAAEADMTFVLLMAQGEDERERARRFLRRDHVDGVVLMSLHGDEPLPRLLARDGIPTVQIGRPLGRAAVPYVDADNRGGARMAVSYLLERGRETIATIAGPSDMNAGVDRLDGYRDALKGAGASIRPSLVEEGDFSEASGYVAMTRLLEREPGLDAVFAASDLMAAGALRALREARRHVPRDVAVVGFDDAPLAQHTMPPLTTVRQPLDELSKRTAELLLRQIADPDAARQEHVVCETSLVRRKSA